MQTVNYYTDGVVRIYQTRKLRGCFFHWFHCLLLRCFFWVLQLSIANGSIARVKCLAVFWSRAQNSRQVCLMKQSLHCTKFLTKIYLKKYSNPFHSLMQLFLCSNRKNIPIYISRVKLHFTIRYNCSVLNSNLCLFFLETPAK